MILVSRAVISGFYRDGIINTAIATSAESEPATATEVVQIERNRAIALDKAADVESVDAAGQTINYMLTVRNEGGVSLPDIVLSDPTLDAPPVFVGGDTDGDEELDVTETWTYTGSYTVTQDDMEAGLDIVNEAVVESGALNSASASATVAVEQLPALSLAKAANLTVVDTVGQLITYTLTVANSGNISLSEIEVSDPSADAPPFYVDGDADGDDRLDVGEMWTYAAVHEVTQDDLDAGEIANTATVDSAESDAAMASALVDVDQQPGIAIGKDVADITSVYENLSPVYRNVPFVYAAGDLIDYTITVTNPGNISLTGVVVIDVAADAPPTRISGDVDGDNQLDVNETWTYRAERTATQQEIDARDDIVNTAAVRSAQTSIVGSVARVKIRVPDFDGNRQVDGNDFILWQRGYGKTENATPSDGNADDDQDVDEIDLDAWEVLFGAPAPPAMSVAALTLEPSYVEMPTRPVRQRFDAPTRRELIDVAMAEVAVESKPENLLVGRTPELELVSAADEGQEHSAQVEELADFAGWGLHGAFK